jgi:uncharacterized protein YbjT (DUF2867 family)
MLIGATGLVGGLAIDRLLRRADIELEVLTRRPTGRSHPRLSERVAPAERWPTLAAGSEAQVAVSALGTTMRKAGSKAAFRAVDHGIVLDFARAARAACARHMICVTSVGADPGSASFYLRVKGEVEAQLAGLGFERLDLIRPGLLRGPRGGDRRPGERIGILLSPLVNLALRGPFDRFAAIDAAVVADAIAALVGAEPTGVFRHHNRDLRRLAAADLQIAQAMG